MYPLYIIYHIERVNIKTLFLKNLLIEIQGPRCWTVISGNDHPLPQGCKGKQTTGAKPALGPNPPFIDTATAPLDLLESIKLLTLRGKCLLLPHVQLQQHMENAPRSIDSLM